MAYSKTEWNQSIVLGPLLAEDPDLIMTNGAGDVGQNFLLQGPGINITGSPLPSTQAITFFTSDDFSAINFTIVGNRAGQIVSEVLAGPNNDTVTSVEEYDFITSITPDSDGSGAMDVGIDGDDNAICDASAVEDGTPMDQNGGWASGFYRPQMPQYLLITCAGNESGNLFTITGQDAAGRTYSYTVPGVNNDTIIIPIPIAAMGWDVTGTLIGGFSSSVALSDDVSLGITNQSATPWVKYDSNRAFWNATCEVGLSSDADLIYSVQTTLQNADYVWPTVIINDLILNNANIDGATAFPGATAFVRCEINSYTAGSLTFDTFQAAASISTVKPSKFNNLQGV